MPFSNGLWIDDATGRAKVGLDQAIPNPAAYNAGWLYAPSTSFAQIDDGGNLSPFYTLGGFLFNSAGQLQVLQSLPGGAPLYNNGVRVSQVGAVPISAGGPIVSYAHGWPLTVNGELCVG